MSAVKIFLVVLIFIVASVAWLVLGQSITRRTQVSEKKLGQDVERMYGPRIVQGAPGVAVMAPQTDGAEFRQRPPDASDIEVTFEHENRYRGLIWFSVYRVHFEASYTFQPDPEDTNAKGRFRMTLPENANIDALKVEIDGEVLEIDRARIDAPLTLRRPMVVKVAYTTAGRDAWEYMPRTDEGGLRNFRLVARTNFTAIDYPATGLSPTEAARTRTDGKPGVEADWVYEQMLPAQNHTIGVVMPRMPPSGKLSARIALFAPVSLFFFFTVMVVIQILKGWKLHPLNYLLIAAGFFAFHILLAYLVDHLPIHGSFWIAAAVSVFLVVSYLWLVLGPRSAIFVAGAAQLIYLVFFSYAFFWEGWTGLTVVIGAILTLFVIMQLTGKIDWAAKLEERTHPRRTTPVAPPPPPPIPTEPAPSDA